MPVSQFHSYPDFGHKGAGPWKKPESVTYCSLDGELKLCGLPVGNRGVPHYWNRVEGLLRNWDFGPKGVIGLDYILCQLERGLISFPGLGFKNIKVWEDTKGEKPGVKGLIWKGSLSPEKSP